MNRILDFTPTDEETIVSRILVQVHKAVDEQFPAAEGASRQFTKTVFSEDNEKTAIDRVAHPSGETAVGDSPNSGAAASLPPERPADASSPQSYLSRLDPMKDHLASEDQKPPHERGIDWVSVVMVGLLLAGLMILGYFLTW